MDLPVLHTMKLLDWAYGGERPQGLEGIEALAKANWLQAAE